MELEVKELCKKYNNNYALKDVNFILNEGVYGLLGENGAGKSTLMRILTTVDIQSSGQVLFNNGDIFTLGEEYREVIGYMPQDYSIYQSFTAYDFLDYMGALKGIPNSLLKKKIPEILEFVNLSSVSMRKVSTFSGGMKRRIGIAQAILNNPKILILDEPTAGLDPKERIGFSNIISEMARDKIVILSTHIVSDIEAIANDIIVMKKGEVLKKDKICNLVDTLENRVYETVVSQEEFKKINKERQVVRKKIEMNRVRVRFIGEPYGNNSKALKPSLEDYYIDVCI